MKFVDYEGIKYVIETKEPKEGWEAQYPGEYVIRTKEYFTEEHFINGLKEAGNYLYRAYKISYVANWGL